MGNDRESGKGNEGDDEDLGEVENIEIKTLNYSSMELTELPTDDQESFRYVNSLFLDYNQFSSLPSDVGEVFSDLKVLSSMGNLLETVPLSFSKLNQLNELYLNENNLLNLPDVICELTSLKILKLTGNQLTVLPDLFGKLTNLQILHIPENKLTNFPASFCDLEELKELDAEFNCLMDLPSDLGKLKNLRILNLSNNTITNVPESLKDLERLESLDISNNDIKILPSSLKSSKTLKKLYMDNNSVCELPTWVSELSNAVEISMEDNRLQNQPLSEDFGKSCSRLKHLNLGGNFMEQLPESFGELLHLEYLHLGSVIDELERRNFQNGNWLVRIPNSFCKMINLKELRLDENQLIELPMEFGNLIHLETIDLGQNRIRTLPESFGNLQSLKICMIPRNHLTHLPTTFGNLQHLEDLRLDNNQITELPRSFAGLKMLKSLDLFNNKLTEVPPVLKDLKNLIRLDIYENPLPMQWKDVPKLNCVTNYVPRNPDLKDNWRGRRPRHDLDMTGDVVTLKEENEQTDEKEESKIDWSEQQLRFAVQRNMSLWQTHDGPVVREKFNRNTNFTWKRNIEEELSNQNGNSNTNNPEQVNKKDNGPEEDCFESKAEKTDDSDSCSSYTEEEEEIFNLSEDSDSYEDCQSSLKDGEENDVSPQPLENWDEEIEDLYGPYEESIPVYDHRVKRDLTDTAEQPFIVYDFHAYPVDRTRYLYPVEDGQFDDYGVS